MPQDDNTQADPTMSPVSADTTAAPVATAPVTDTAAVSDTAPVSGQEPTAQVEPAAQAPMASVTTGAASAPVAEKMPAEVPTVESPAPADETPTTPTV